MANKEFPPKDPKKEGSGKTAEEEAIAQIVEKLAREGKDSLSLSDKAYYHRRRQTRKFIDDLAARRKKEIEKEKARAAASPASTPTPTPIPPPAEKVQPVKIPDPEPVPAPEAKPLPPVEAVSPAKPERQVSSEEENKRIIKPILDSMEERLRANARVSEMRLKKIQGDLERGYAKNAGRDSLPSDRKHIPGALKIERVSPTEYAKAAMEAEEIGSIPLSTEEEAKAKNRRGFFMKDPEHAVRVETDAELGLVGKYTTVGKGNEKVVALSGALTEREAQTMSILQKQKFGVPLTPKESAKYLENGPVTKRVDAGMEEQHRKESLEVVQIAKDLMNHRDLTPEQERLLGDRTILGRVKKMLREDRLETEYDMKKIPKLFEKIEKSYPEATDDLIDTRKYVEGKQNMRERLGMSLENEKFDNSPEEKLLVSQKTQVEKAFDKMRLNKTKLLEAVPNFFHLDDSQQIYALEKLRQTVNRDATLEAREIAKSELGKKVYLLTSPVKYAIKRWKIMRTPAREAKAKKEFLSNATHKEMADYYGDFKDIVNHVSGMSPINYDENGVLRIEYEKPSGPEDRETIRFNEAATALSEIPYEWTLKDSRATKKEKREYQKALALYESERNALATVKKKEYQKEDPADVNPKLAFWLSKLNDTVATGQRLNWAPELKELKDEGGVKGIGNKIANIFVKHPEVGVITSMLLGRQARVWFRESTSLFVAGPVLAGLSGILAWRKEGLTYKTKEEEQRYGAGHKDKGIKKYLDAKKSAKKINDLVDRIERAETAEERDKMAEFLKLRLQKVDAAMKEGRMNFGRKPGEVTAIHEAMGRASMTIYKCDEAGKKFTDDLKSRFKRFYKARQRADRYADIRKYARQTGMASIAFAASGAGFVGSWLATDYFAETGSGQAYKDRLKEIFSFKSMGEGDWNDVPEGTIPSVPPETQGIPVAPAAPEPEALETEPTPAPEAEPAPEVADKTPEDSRDTNPETVVDDKMQTIRDNLVMKRDVNGNLVYMEIDNARRIIDVDDLKKNFDNLRIPGTEQSLRPAFNDVKEFRVWEASLKAYPDGTPEHEWIEGRMREIGERISNRVGHIFAPYEDMLKDGASVSPETPGVDFEDIKNQKAAEGFEHTRSGYSDVFSKEVPLSSPEDLADNLPESALPDASMATEFAEEVRRNSDGSLTIIDVASVPEAKAFASNPRNFLTADMSKWGYPENFRTPSSGIVSLNRVSSEAQEFLAWERLIKGVPEGSDDYLFIENRMQDLGKHIHGKVGPIFAPYEEWAPEHGSSAEIPADATASLSAAPVETPIQNAPTPEPAPSAPIENTPWVPAAPAESFPEVNEDIVTPSHEGDNLVLDFDDDKIHGRLTLIENEDGEIVGVEEKPDFETEAGRNFRADPYKYISQEDIDTIVEESRGTKTPYNSAQVLDFFERGINEREALRLSGLPTDSSEALALDKRIKDIDSFFFGRTPTRMGFLDRLKIVEGGSTIGAVTSPAR